MTLASKIFLAVLPLPCLGFATWFTYHELCTPQNEREGMDRQIELVRAGRYDKAIQVIEVWMNNPRRDVSQHGLLDQQIGIAYFAKAWSAGLRVDLLEIGRAHAGARRFI